MVQQHTAIDSLFVLSQLLIAFHCVVCHSCKLESVGQFVEQRVILWNFLDDLGQTIIVLEHSEGLDKAFVVFGSEIKLSRFVPLQSLCIKIAKLVGHFAQNLIITWTLLNHL